MTTVTQLVFHRFSRLGEAERQVLSGAMTAPQKFGRHCELVNSGGSLPALHMVLSGIAGRYDCLQNGQRQILGYFFPGDVFDVRACFSQSTDSRVQSLTTVQMATLRWHDLLASAKRSPGLVREFWRLVAVEDATTRQWQLNAGRRSAIQRLSHLLCECFARLSAVGLTEGDGCLLPFSQTDIADALSLTPVHVNRTLMELRAAELATLKARRLTILDAPALYAVAEFEPAYLQLKAAPFEARSEVTATSPSTWRPSATPA